MRTNKISSAPKKCDTINFTSNDVLFMDPRADTSLDFQEVSDTRRRSLMLFGLVVGSAVGLWIIALAMDISLWNLSAQEIWATIHTKGLAQSMGSLGEVMAAVLGLSLTVVAIVVQLASQRYPAKIVDLFMMDRRNILFFGSMAASCIYVLLAPLMEPHAKATPITTGFALLLVIVNFGLLLPYFGYVFAFLEPNNIITKIRDRAEMALVHASKKTISPVGIKRLQRHVRHAIDRIADNSMAAVDQCDRNLAMHTVRSLEGFICDYLHTKTHLNDEWSTPEANTLNTLAQEFRDEIVATNTWVEAKTLMEFERIFRMALTGQMSEMISQIAASSRHIGQKALSLDQKNVLDLTIQFFNTYMRHSLNARNVRAAYNVLYEYRQFASAMLEARAPACTQVVEHMVYYGRTANSMKLPFVTVTVAHDVRVLCEQAFRLNQQTDRDEIDLSHMLDQFLSLDQPSEDEGEEVALLGVRRAQSILGAFFLSKEATHYAEQIRRDMSHEPQSRLKTTRDAILAVKVRKFWEVTDRGFNFDYVDPALHPYIVAFFEPMLRDPMENQIY